MKLLPLPREKRRLLEPLGRAALTCLLTAGSFGGLCAPLPLAITAAAGPLPILTIRPSAARIWQSWIPSIP